MKSCILTITLCVDECFDGDDECFGGDDDSVGGVVGSGDSDNGDEGEGDFGGDGEVEDGRGGYTGDNAVVYCSLMRGVIKSSDLVVLI